MVWPKGKAMPKYFLCRMVYIFLFPRYWPFFTGPRWIPRTKASEAEQFRTEIMYTCMSWPTAGFHCRSVIVLGKTMKVQKWKFVKPDADPHPMDLCCAFWITTTPHSWLHEVRYISSKCVLVKCLYQRLYPWAKYWTQPWSVTRWIKDNIGMKGIIVMKMMFHSLLSCQWKNFTYNSSICTGQVFPVSDHTHWETLRHGRNLA